MKTPFFAVAVALVAPSLAHAQSISIVADQVANHIEQLGYPTGYEIVSTPAAQRSINWSIRQNDADCQSAYINPEAGAQYNPGYRIPGEFDIKADIIEPGRQPYSLTKHVVIAVPTVSRVMGTNADGSIPSSPYGTQRPGSTAAPATATGIGGEPGIWILFMLASGGKPVGVQVDITTQENITNQLDLTTKPPTLGRDEGWTPTGADTRFYLGSIQQPNNDAFAAICDFKWNGSLPPHASGKYFTYTQENQITYTTFCNTKVFKSLGTINFAISGTINPDTWTTGTTP